MVATADAALRPQSVRLWALRARADADVLEFCVQRSASPRFFANLSSGGRVALNAIEVDSYRSRTFKGFCRICEHAPDPAFVEQSLSAMQRAFAGVGMTEDSVQRILAHSDPPGVMVALSLEVDSVFDQSPKQGAGARL
jgi:hypothetical protein